MNTAWLRPHLALATTVMATSLAAAAPEKPAAEKEPPADPGVCALTMTGSRVVVCRSEWHKIRITSKVTGEVCLLPADVAKLLPPTDVTGSPAKTWRVADSLAASLAKRIFDGMKLTPDDPEKMTHWLGTGTRPEFTDSVKGGGRLQGAVGAVKVVQGRKLPTATCQGVLTLRHSSALASRFGPNRHDADWSLKVRGELAFDPKTRHVLAGKLTAEGTIKGRYHNANPNGEPYTETVKLALTVAAPASKEALARIAALIRQLGDDSYRKREAATAALRKIGRAAKWPLKAALESDDPEIQSRARQLLDEIDPPTPTPKRPRDGEIEIFLAT